MKIYDLSAQPIFPSKQCTTYEYTPELVVTVPAARSTIVKKIKPLVYLRIFTNISLSQSPTRVHLLSSAVEHWSVNEPVITVSTVSTYGS